MKNLLNRRHRAATGLPPLADVLRGSVVVRALRCGKPTCRCADGEPHRATYLSVTFAGGRTEQISIPAELMALVERQVANYHAWWNAIEKVSAINRELLRAERQKRVPRKRPERTPPRGKRHRP
jgi:hypothetical protein